MSSDFCQEDPESTCSVPAYDHCAKIEELGICEKTVLPTEFTQNGCDLSIWIKIDCCDLKVRREVILTCPRFSFHHHVKLLFVAPMYSWVLFLIYETFSKKSVISFFFFCTLLTMLTALIKTPFEFVFLLKIYWTDDTRLSDLFTCLHCSSFIWVSLAGSWIILVNSSCKCHVLSHFRWVWLTNATSKS